MPFRGFNIKYPEYEVITPQTHLSFSVRTLNVSEEERLKGSLMTPTKIMEHLNKCLYETCVKKPDSIKDYKTFLKSLTLKDREVILYGLYHITYEDIRNYDVRCSSCKKEYQVTAKASDMFNYNPYPGEDVLTRRIKVELPLSPGVSAYIKQPTLNDEVEAVNALSSAPGVSMDIISETLIIDHFEQVSPDASATAEGDIIYDSRQDVIDAYRNLPSKDRKVISETFNENFGKYGMELKMKTFCNHCGSEEVVDVDLSSNFFRMVYTA